MDKIEHLVKSLAFDKYIEYDDIPNIDLYMDQVIQLFENTYSGSTRNNEEKILTKTMINNYAKGKLLFPIKNKKYSKEHIILLSLIYQLKGALSINDIKTTLNGINERIVNNDIDTEAFYHAFLTLCKQNEEQFHKELALRMKKVKNEAEPLDSKADFANNLEQILLIASLINMSNMYRRVAEKLVDEISENDCQPNQ